VHRERSRCWTVLIGAVLLPSVAAAQQAGSIRGVVYDKDFDAPIAAAEVLTVETRVKVTTSDDGNYYIGDVPPGQYTLVFSKAGYVRQVRTGVVVAAGQLTEVEARLEGDFTDMEECVVQDVLNMGTTTEAALMQLRLDSPALMDSISSDLMNRAGVGDAASALRLVAGATTNNGRSAVIRGLPDRYVSSQLNGLRLPTADEDKRAVDLDLFPSAMIDSIQVAKTFTPDQQGDASGGAVNIRSKGIPDETTFSFKAQMGANSQVLEARDSFLTYDGGGVSFWGFDDGGRDPQLGKLGQNWDGAVGTTTGDAPLEYKFTGAAGGQRELDSGIKIGGYLNMFYERGTEYYDDGVVDNLWVDSPGGSMVPQQYQASGNGEFYTGLYDVTQGLQAVQWGGLGTLGLETENHSIGLTALYSHSAEDKATLATDTRGKAYFFPGYDPNDPSDPGNQKNAIGTAPYIRTETLAYTERTSASLQLDGLHRLPDFWGFREPDLDWIVAVSSSDLNQPDKRQFGAAWQPGYLDPGAPPFLPPFQVPPTWIGYKPGANYTLGNLQRIWKEIDEQSLQGATNLELPFEQWGGEEGYLKLGLFADQVDREFRQDTYSNFGDNSSYAGEWNEPWSAVFPSQPNHPITESLYDVDYDGELDVSAAYSMVDLPLSSSVNVIGGARLERTYIKTVNDPDPFAQWLEPGETQPKNLTGTEADVDFSQENLLPSLGLAYEPMEGLTLRGSYGQTVARQTFKEITPIIQQEFAGGPIFVGNPYLGMSSLDNWDLRADWVPYEGALVSVSWFYKDIEDPIEYVQQPGASFTYTTAVNYPEGRLNGWELELRQNLGTLIWEGLESFGVGANATLIDSEVTLSADEQKAFGLLGVPMDTRPMTGAPDYLFNFFLTYDWAPTGTQAGLFYTVQGDTLVAGAGQANGNFIPSVYALPFDRLNLSFVQRLGQHFKLEIKGMNLTNPAFKTVYRSEYVPDGDVLKTSRTAGIDVSFALAGSWSF